MVGCLHGEIVHVQVPSELQLYTDVSYLLKLSTKHAQFTTYKSQIRRDIKIAEIERRKAAKVERKREEMEAIKKENPGLDIDEDVFLADSDSEEELEPLFIPPVPNRILWMQSMIDDTIWLSMAGYCYHKNRVYCLVHRYFFVLLDMMLDIFTSINLIKKIRWYLIDLKWSTMLMILK